MTDRIKLVDQSITHKGQEIKNAEIVPLIQKLIIIKVAQSDISLNC